MLGEMESGVNRRPFRVAVIGSGPSGFYAVEALLEAFGAQISCDILERLPTPFGLVRGGVAPDHQSIKKVASHYERIAHNPQVRFFGNVKVGGDMTPHELDRFYDAVIYAIGNERDRHLAVPGMDLPGCYSATGFVGWYNGHPDFKKHEFDLDHETAAVIGIGNVAIDVARVLARHPDEWGHTDIAGYVVPKFRSIKKLKRIYVLGRRGAAQAACTLKELKELAQLKHADLIVEPDEIAADRKALEDGSLKDSKARQIVRYLGEIADRGPSGKPRQVILRFCLSPVEFLEGANRRLAGVRLEKNEVRPDGNGVMRPYGTGQFIHLDAGVVFKAVGYRGNEIPGVPFDKRTGTIPNIAGRILKRPGSQEVIPGEYVVGWAKRGPTGLIGTNKLDAIETVKTVVADYPNPPLQGPHRAKVPDESAIVETLEQRNVRYVTFKDWKRIDAQEVRVGQKQGKVREKFTSVKDTMKFLGHNS